MIETELTEGERMLLGIIRREPYAYPPLMRSMTRLKNGVPPIKVEALLRSEIALARAKAHHDGA